ncbi:hypothetical protein [Sulfurospirillum barnesii]|uniref:Uncharacterized protein n=1 Tax=Sulfurospirillum barnesii (strain ATCC 700032 / DSM 10660 / SES-3) TaxID=760154 RepID=I3XXJ0_SULBS|nr:hypothetical protein [Sulfurospirillum barnesii]AFL68664.1 hypothetical protein Sulba_1375 [Sulfurospirillum barnesii SES-3]
MKQISNYIKRLYHGDISLFTTFWIYGFLIQYILAFIFSTLGKLYNQQLWLVFLICFLAFLEIIYAFFASIAIWRSANKYQGDKKWADGAKLYIVISIYMLISTLYLRV